MSSDFQRKVNRFFYGSGFPLTVFLIVFNILTWFTFASLHSRDPFQYLIFFGGADMVGSAAYAWPHGFWTILTWPLDGSGDPLNVAFACLWAWWVCGSLERSWGTRTFGLFFFGTTALMAFATWVGGHLLGLPVALWGLAFGIAPATIAWCTVNKGEVVRLFGILPITAPLLGALTLAIVWYEVGTPWLGLFALSGCAVAYWYASSGRYAYNGYSTNRSPLAGRNTPRLRLRTYDPQEERASSILQRLSPLRKYRARRERRRLEDLWKRSNLSDPEEKDRPGR